MINKIYKTIHIKYSRFFEFIFFLRYLLLIFLISISIFFISPVFFNYERKAEAIKLHLLNNYNFEIRSYEGIKYNIFPLPNLEIINAQINLKPSVEDLNVKKIKIYPNILNIYNYKNFSSRKINLKEVNAEIQASDLKSLLKELFQKENKLSFLNLKIKIVDEKIPVLTLDNIKYKNFGYNKNLIRGRVLGKNFKIKIDDNYKNINFKLLNSGIKVDINFDKNQKNNLKFGTLRSKILNNNFKSNFEYDGKIIKIDNAYFRSKSLSFKNESEIILNPFLDINSNFIVEELNTQILTKIEFINLLKFKDLLRKINNKSEIKFKPKKFNRNFFKDLNLKVNLAYGRMNYSKKLFIANSTIKCDGNINFLEEYPLLFFDCHLKTENKRELLKKFSVKAKNKKENLELKVKGNLNVFNKKVNFKNILMNDNYSASKEDLKYFKNSFENIVFDKNFFEIFDLKKMREFILEIS